MLNLHICEDIKFAADVTYDNAQSSDFKGFEVLTSSEGEVEYYLKLKELLVKACGVALEEERLLFAKRVNQCH